MTDRAVLDVRAHADGHQFVVAAQHGVPPDADVLLQLDVSDDGGVRRYPIVVAVRLHARVAQGVFHGSLESSLSGSVPSMRRRSDEHTSELQSLMRISYAVFCLKKK